MAAAVTQAPSGSALASAGLRYVGSRYRFGGAPGTVKGKDAGTDCSGFISMILGRDMGRAIPGYSAGAYTGATHGPVVSQYASWKGATTLPKGTSAQAGDLCVWNGVGASGHIGIAVDSSHMVSALDTEAGVVHTPIKGYGPIGAPFLLRRLNGVPGGAAPGADTTSVIGSILGGGDGGGGGFVLASLGIGAAVPLVMIGVILGGAALLGVGGAFLIGAALRRAQQ